MVIIRFGHDYEETCMQMDEVRSGGGGAARGRKAAAGSGGRRPAAASLPLLTPRPAARRSWRARRSA